MRSALLDVVNVVTVTPRSPPSPIPGIRPMRTPDTPVDVLVVAAVIDVALSLLCPLSVAAGGTQPLRQLVHHRRLWGGGMRSALLNVIVVVAVTPQSPPSPIPGIRQTRTPKTPVDVFIINAVVDVALSPLCPPPVVGKVVVVFVLVVVVIIILPPGGGGAIIPPPPSAAVHLPPPRPLRRSRRSESRSDLRAGSSTMVVGRACSITSPLSLSLSSS